MSKEIDTSVEVMEGEALSGAAQCDKGAPTPTETKPLPQGMAAKPVEQKSPAEWAYQRLILYIRNFEESLNAEEEAAFGFAGSDAGLIRIEGLGFFAPDLISFTGRDIQGHRTTLIQHVSQLNVALRAVPKFTQDAPPIRVGFALAEALDGEIEESAPAT
ncbi:MAG: DUF6173 family protein [Pseudomonadota bacterium]